MRAPGRTLGWIAGAVVVAMACEVDDKRRGPLEPDAGGGGPAEPDGAVPLPGSAPDTVIDAAPEPFSNQQDAAFRFSSSEPRATFHCSIDEGAEQPCQSPYVRRLADGPHRFSVRATDDAGRADDTPAEWGWTIDSVAPETVLTDQPPQADNSVTARFAFRASERDASFACSLDGADEQPCDSGIVVGPIGDGAHAFAVRARDRAGNVDPSPATLDWIVDLTPPDTTIVDGPSGKVPVATASLSFTASEPNASFACSLDGAEFTPCSSPASLGSLDRGDHVFAVRATDAVGQVDPTPATRAWTVVGRRPRPSD